MKTFKTQKQARLFAWKSVKTDKTNPELFIVKVDEPYDTFAVVNDIELDNDEQTEQFFTYLEEVSV